MVLLAALKKMADAGEVTLNVAHAHHQLRGADSDADEDLVVSSAAAGDLPIHTGRLPVQDSRKQTQESLEMTARRLRHRFLARTAVQAGIGTIALAHHADDQAELILLRLLRGAGGEGLGGMSWLDASPVEPTLRLIRPLLDCSKAELHQFASQEGISFRNDVSNQDRAILRNRIRHELLPYLEQEFNPALRQALLRTAQIVGAEADWVAQAAAQWRESARPRAFDRLPVALQRAVIRQQLWDLGHDGDFERVEQLRVSTTPVTTSPQHVLQREPDGTLHFRPTPPPTAFQSDRVEAWIRPRMAPVCLGEVTLVGSVGPFRRVPLKIRPQQESFDLDSLGSRVVFRHWQPGDRFQPLGQPRPVKLQDLFVNRKIPLQQRRKAVLGVSESGAIFWVEGLPPGERFKLGIQTRRVLTLKWRRGH